MLLVIRVIVIR